VSYFAFGFLVRSCAVGAELYDPAQIGIEVRVPRPPCLGVKEEITKDLVIWARPGETCWEAPRRSGRFPLAVMQWKVNEGGVSADDVAWLVALTTHEPDVAVMLCASTSNPEPDCGAIVFIKGRSKRDGWRSNRAVYITSRSSGPPARIRSPRPLNRLGRRLPYISVLGCSKTYLEKFGSARSRCLRLKCGTFVFQP